ncbi:hypothetical protein LUZ60_017224 [Juncus effusus]|nr:hypothetical protein LUZ60_017224 [Juncus effusus]
MRQGPVFTENQLVSLSPPPSVSAMADGLGPHSAWHSPVPYLFGGLAAMLGLIALALLILACSYWKLSGYLDSNGESNDSSADQREKQSSEGDAKMVVVQREHVAVIMAGEERPTYLATAVERRKEEEGVKGEKSLEHIV